MTKHNMLGSFCRGWQKKVKKAFTGFVAITTIVWSLGIPAFIPQGGFFNVSNYLLPKSASAALVTASGPFDLLPGGGMAVPNSSFDIAVMRVALNQSSSPGGETLDTVTVTVTSTVPTNNATLASHITSLVVFRDSNGNNNFDPPNDAFAGTQGTVNVGAPTTVTLSSNKSLAASGAMPTSFFVAVKTAAGWAAGDSIYISMAANGLGTSANSPTVTPLVGSKAISFGGGGGGGWSGFSVSQVNQVDATNVDVTFTDTLDLNSGAATSTISGNYILKNASSVAVGISSVVVLPDNKSVRITAPTSTILTDGTWTLTVSANVKNTMGMGNGNTAPMPIFGGILPLLVSEVKVGAAADQYDEFVEIYNRSAGTVPVSGIKLHMVNAAGTVDKNIGLTFLANVSTVPAHGFLLIAPITSPASTTADAVYTTSSISTLAPDGAVYISNSAATSSAVLDKVCWGSHAVTANCEGTAALALTNNDQSLERKAFNASTSDSMKLLGSDAGMGNALDTQNNNFDFVARAIPLPQNSTATAEEPTGGFYGGAGNGAPSIMHAPVFRASASSSLNIVARMFDDGGQLPSGNTQLIYCTDNVTCTPVSSTPIFGVSIGSGWYKFTPTTTPWSNNKTKLKYYLQARDSATPALSKVFTSDPNYDTVTYNTSWTGIQTATDQQNKALTIELVQDNLGSASINGTVNDSSGAAISGATVWIDGTQFAATTGNDGTFSFANVGPSGGIQVKIAKEGYADQSISTFLPATGLVSLPTITLYSGMMGQGGDFTGPSITNTFPMQNMMGAPTQNPEGGAMSIEVNFSKDMATSTISDLDASDAGSNVYLTEAGSGTKLAGSVLATAARQARFTPASALTVGKTYTLFLTPAIKDTAGNPISGNGPGGSYILSFSTAGQMFSDPGQVGGNFGMGSAFPPFVVGSQPAPGKSNVALNTKAFVSFSEALKNDSTNLANVKLYLVTGAFSSSETATEVSAAKGLDASNKIVIITPSASLSASSHYRVVVLGGLTSAKGISLGNPGITGYATQSMFKADFDTGTASDSTAPTVSGTIPADSVTAVSTVKPITLNFSEGMDPSTITSNSVTLKLGSTSVTGDLSYDPTNRTATFVPAYALSPTSTYTITVSTDAKDLAGLNLDQDSVTVGNQSLQRTFTTGSPDLSSPVVNSAQANDYALKVTFSKPMLALAASDMNYANSALKAANYSVRVVSSAGATVSTVTLPSTAAVSYDGPSRSVSITGLSPISGFVAGTTLINVTVSNVKDIGFNALASGGNAATTTAQSSATTGNFSGGMGGMVPMMDASGNMIQGGMMGGPPPMVGTYSASGIGFVPGVKVRPFNSMAGASTIYGVEVPLSSQIPNAGFIDITFPEGTDVSNAKKDQFSPPNNDMNGPGPGIVVFGTSEGTLPTGWTTGGQASDGVIVDAVSRKVRVILGAVATRCGTGNTVACGSDTHDFLRFDIAQIVNSTISTSIDTSGSSATVETKKSDGTVLETLSSGSFFTTAAGSFTLRGHVTTTALGVNGANVFLMSSMTGPMSSSSAYNRYGGNNGEFLFQNLQAGQYMLGVEQYFKSGGTSYTASFPVSVNISSGTCTSNVCTQDIIVTNASTGATVTLGISGAFSNDAVDIFAGGPGSFRMSTTTLNGTLTNNTDNTIKLNANGVWMIGFGPAASADMFGKSGSMVRPAWMPPRPQEVLVSACPSACSAAPSTVVFNVGAANKTVKFTVKDASGNAIGNAHVFAYSPTGNTGNDTSANADGTGSVGLSYGNYKIGASVSGMPGGAERSILIKDDGGTDKVFVDGSATGIALTTMAVSDLILTISKPPYTISGKVTDGTNATANVPVSAYRTNGPGHSETFTNSSGDYTLYVNAGIWKVQAFSPQYGKLAEKTITITTSNSSGQNFEPNTASTNYATITKSVGSDTDSDGALETGEGVSNAQVTIQGTTATGEQYLNTSLTDSNGSSTLKVPPGTYTMNVWSPAYGEMSSSSQPLVVNSAGQATTAPYDVLAPKFSTVVVNLFDEYGNVTTSADIVVDFQQLNGKAEKIENFSNVASTTLSLPAYDAGTDSAATGAVTSTNPNNFYLMEVTVPGLSQSDLIVYGNSNTITATSSASTGLWKVELDGAQTEVINIKLPSINYVNGTVKDASNNAISNATVHLVNKTTGDAVDVAADTSGNYTAKVSDGDYLVSVMKDGYLDTATSVSVSASTTLSSSYTTADVANSTISGTITISGVVASGAVVRAEKLGGGVVTATTNAGGVYSLLVTSGSWKVSASADGYAEKAYGSVVTSGASGININLTVTKSSLAGSTSSSVTPQTGGALSNSDANSTVGSPGLALGNDSNSATLNSKEVSSVVGGGVGTPISGEAKSVTSYDYNGNEVTLLDKDITVGATYSNSDLTASLGALTIDKIEKVLMSSWDETSDNWQNLPTTISYKDANGKFIEPSTSAASVTFSGQTSHLSVFNPTVPSDSLAPAAPTNASIAASSGSVTVTWAATSLNADGTALTDLLGYEVYRATSPSGVYTQVNTTNVTGVRFVDSTVTNGETYYYKITAADTGGVESAFSTASEVARPSESISTGSTGSSGGGGGGGSEPATPVAVTQPVASQSPASSIPAATAPSSAPSMEEEVESAVRIAVPEVASYQPTASLKFTYKYQNLSGIAKLKIVRQLVNSKGKAVRSVSTVKTIKNGGVFVGKINDALKGLAAGDYTEKIKILNAKTGKVLEENSFPITVEKLKKRTFKMGEVSDISSPVVFDEAMLAKVKTSAVLPYILKLKFSYANNTEEKQVIKMVRDLLNAKGKVVSSKRGRWVMVPGESDSSSFTQPVAANLSVGSYTMRIRALDWKTKEVLAENSAGFEVVME